MLLANYVKNANKIKFNCNVYAALWLITIIIDYCAQMSVILAKCGCLNMYILYLSLSDIMSYCINDNFLL